MKRREFLVLPFGGVLEYKVPLRFFTQGEAQIVSAACERIFPTDENGPGAKEAGVAIYIDRQLAGPYGRDKYRYLKAPFFESIPEHGYQGKASPRDIYREGLGMLGQFTALSVREQDERLRAIESSLFFQMLRLHTLEGMFCDPLHGGNSGLAGWRLIEFPGPRMTYEMEIDRHYGKAWRPEPASLQDVLKRPVHGWEDEKE